MKISHTVGIAALVASIVGCGTLGDKLGKYENTVKITPLSIDFVKNGRKLGIYLCIPSDGYLGLAYMFNTNSDDSIVLDDENGSKKIWFNFTDMFSRNKVSLFTNNGERQLIDSKTMRPYECGVLEPFPNYQT